MFSEKIWGSLLESSTRDKYIVYPASNISSPQPIYSHQQIIQENNKANVIILTNPLDSHFSVQPLSTGCGSRQKISVNSDTRACVATNNTGFFDMNTDAFIGNNVSNGEFVQKTCNALGNV